MKLTGLTVLDLSSFLPGPYLTLMLADHGARVIKVEMPGEGDPTRHLGLADGPSTVYFRVLNRGKESCVLDLKSADGRDALYALVDRADVLVESFRPGVAKRLGIDYATLAARNPRLVYCSISAFGQDGPYRDRPAHDLAVESIAGLISQTLGPDDRPAMPGIPVADIVCALQGVSGVLMALHARNRTGRGDYLDLSMQDVTVAACLNILGPTLAKNEQPIAKHQRTTGGGAFYRLYGTRDGKHLALAGQESKFIRNLLNALGRPDLVEPCLRGPGPQQQPAMDFLAATFATRTRDEWDAWLATLDVCYGAVKTLPEALADPNLLARGMVETDALGRRQIGNPIRFADEPARPNHHEPALGEHTEAILATLGRNHP